MDYSSHKVYPESFLSHQLCLLHSWKHIVCWLLSPLLVHFIGWMKFICMSFLFHSAPPLTEKEVEVSNSSALWNYEAWAWLSFIYTFVKGITRVWRTKHWVLLINLTVLRLGWDRESPSMDIGKDGPWGVCLMAIFCPEMHTDTISTQHSESSTGFGIRPSMVESWLCYCLCYLEQVNDHSGLVSLYMDISIYGYNSSYQEGCCGINELRNIKLIAGLAYSRCSIRSSFQFCHHQHHWWDFSSLSGDVCPLWALVHKLQKHRQS